MKTYAVGDLVKTKHGKGKVVAVCDAQTLYPGLGKYKSGEKIYQVRLDDVRYRNAKNYHESEVAAIDS